MAAILRKYDEKAYALHNLIKNAPINFIFDVATVHLFSLYHRRVFL